MRLPVDLALALAFVLLALAVWWTMTPPAKEGYSTQTVTPDPNPSVAHTSPPPPPPPHSDISGGTASVLGNTYWTNLSGAGTAAVMPLNVSGATHGPAPLTFSVLPAPPLTPLPAVAPTTTWTPIMNATIPGPNYSSNSTTLGSNDMLYKSSLVPCTCPTFSMSCPVHAGSKPSSSVPGQVSGDTASALSKAQNQFDVMRPFNNTANDVPGYLNSFSSFGS